MANAGKSTFFDGIASGFRAFATSRSRLNEINRLTAMSDAELAARGIRREDITRHVFRDVLYI